MSGRLTNVAWEVVWVDSCLQNYQVGKDEYPKPEEIISVGFLVEQTDEYITLARDDMKLDQFRGLICIPTECVKRAGPINGLRDALGI